MSAPRRRLAPQKPPKDETWEERGTFRVADEDDERTDHAGAAKDEALHECTHVNDYWRPALLVAPDRVVETELRSSGAIEFRISASEGRARHVLIAHDSTQLVGDSAEDVYRSDDSDDADVCCSGWTVVPFSDELDGVSANALWRCVRAPTRFAVVRDVKELLSRTARDPMWKALMARELESLADACYSRNAKLERLRLARETIRKALDEAKDQISLLRKSGKGTDITCRAQQGICIELIKRLRQVAALAASFRDVADLQAEEDDTAECAAYDADDTGDPGERLIDIEPKPEPEPVRRRPPKPPTAKRTEAKRVAAAAAAPLLPNDGYSGDEDDDKEEADEDDEATLDLDEDAVDETADDAAAVSTADVEDAPADAPSALLDSILAMIFVRYPRRSGTSREAHNAWLSSLHTALVDQWRDEIVCLPRGSDAPLTE
ncbi:hypothetical protein M885DRAFT_522182 [Pelagophyceae sp. CCMP2097]|nr:hypothetical protein M885DRAFT_522182 [Pelagophyceae sp. CCMP2097]|mmetsp:Transcript_15721/g.52980  ORF Transcript_15721/g.52980 Transcript_15721/m.52980 type:complete len:435 (-) Transcript_15721:57-1361(-)